MKASCGRYIIDLSDPEACDAEQVGPKAASQAALARAGLPTPGGFGLGAAAYRRQLEYAGVAEAARTVAGRDRFEVRDQISRVRIGLFEAPIAPDIKSPLLHSWRAMVEASEALTAVRSSALVEDRDGSSFAGQFESFLGVENEADFLVAVRACWAALWSPRAMRHMEEHAYSPAETAMAVLVQPLIEARASGGGMSRTADEGMTITATWGLGSSIAQGEIVPDRYELDRTGRLRESIVGRKTHSVQCRTRRAEPVSGAVDGGRAAEPCLDKAQVAKLADMMLKAEEAIGGPVEVEWAQDAAGIKLVQARPLSVAPPAVPDEIWRLKPGLRGHPSGIGWGAGRACVIHCECELSRVAPGDILVTKVAGPALGHVLPRVAGIVAELGGSTSHLANLARERGIPMVLGLFDATQAIPDGAQVGLDGVTGLVRWIS